MAVQLQSTIPVFCTAKISANLLNEFFTQSLAAPELEGADWIAAGNIGHLELIQKPGALIDTLEVESIAGATKAPVPEPSSYPFLDWNVMDIAKFAERNFRKGVAIVPNDFVVLDEQTKRDKTCLLVTLRESSYRSHEGERLTVRADFRSSLVILNVKALGCGGDGHFEIAGSDGVIRLNGPEPEASARGRGITYVH